MKKITFCGMLFSFLLGNTPILHAQTGGPGQMEFSSFEPANGQSGVNPLTGDYTYNQSLIHLPGPGGGYDINIFNHTGIKVDQPASWVGLGWNINPGAINRSIVGKPDDGKDKQTLSIRQNELGYSEVEMRSLSIMGLLSFSDVYSKVNNQTYSSMTTRFLGGLYNYTEGDLPKASSSSIPGIRSELLSSKSFIIPLYKFGAIGWGQMKYRNFYSIFGINRNYGLNYLSDGYASSNILNFLSTGETCKGGSWLSDDCSYSSLYANYSLSPQDLQQSVNLLDFYSNPYDKDENAQDKGQHCNLSFPGYDVFHVAAPNISGSFRSYINENISLVGESTVYTFKKEAANCGNKSIYYPETMLLNTNSHKITPNVNSPKLKYTYLNDGLASVTMASNGWNIPADNPNDVEFPLTTITLNADNIPSSGSFYNSTKNKIGSSKNIEWFTNAEISAGNATNILKESRNLGLDRTIDPNGIGAFVVTDAQGFTYHFGLPVYQYEQIEMTGIKDSETENHQTNISYDPIAVTWLLTGITGPDFIDKEGDNWGILDEEDEGYWVAFNYGKWSDGYIWRTPYYGDEYISLEDNFVSMAMGRKELYYVNSIETKTHIAYFVKSLRVDGVGATSEAVINAGSASLEYNYKDYYDWAINIQNSIFPNFNNDGTPYVDIPQDLIAMAHYNHTIKYDDAVRVRPLKLDSILVFSKQSLNNIDFSAAIATNTIGIFEHSCVLLSGEAYYSDNGSHVNVTNQACFDNGTPITSSFSSYYPANILDINDVSNYQNISSQALGVIRFVYKDIGDGLAQHSPNTLPAVRPHLNDPQLGGRLTLEKIITRGLGSQKIAPSVEFTYYNNGNYDKYAADSWGYYNSPYATTATLGKVYRNIDVIERNAADNWSLKSVKSPLGGEIQIKYESDSYNRQALWGRNERTITEFDFSVTNTTGSTSHDLVITCPYADEIASLVANGATVNIELNDLMIGCMNNGNNNTIYPCSYLGTYPITNVVGNEILRVALSCTYDECACFGVAQGIATGKIIISNYIGYGGGIRVKELLIKENANADPYKIGYNYNNPLTNNSSGVTSYAPRDPDHKESEIPYPFEIPSPEVIYEYVTTTQYDQQGTAEYHAEAHYETYPNAIYDNPEQNPTLSLSFGDIFKIESSPTYWNSYNHDFPNEQYPSNPYILFDGIYSRDIKVHDKMTRLGRPLETKTYNFNKQVVLDKTHYEYYDNDELDLGIRQESYNNIKCYVQATACDDALAGCNHTIGDKPFFNWFFTTSSRITYPNLLKSVTTEAGGLKSEISYSDYDIYTGIPKTATTTNGYGETIKKITQFAHDNSTYDYTALSSKVYDITYKNMLTAPLKATTTNNNQTMSVGVATYSNNWKYRERDGSGLYHTVAANATNQWRSDASYSWKGLVEKNGSLGNVANFPFNSPPQISSNPNQGWERVSEPTLYDHSSHVLEARGMNNRFVSTKYGYGKYMRTLASVANARYTEFAYSGAEDVLDGSWAEFGGEVGAGVPATSIYTAASPIDAYTHTGYHSIRLETNQWGLGYSGTIGNISDINNNNVTDAFQGGKTYRASVWVRAENGVQLNNWFKLNATVTNSSNQVLHTYITDVTATTTFKAGDWYLLNLDIPLSQYPNAYKVSIGTCNLNASMPVYVDDFRVHPLDAPLKSYVYDKVGRVIAVLDNDNIASRFTYDAASNVIKSEQETKDGFRVISQEQMHFARPLE